MVSNHHCCSSRKVLVIGRGSFGNALCQGLRHGGRVEHSDGTHVSCTVVQVSASNFARLPQAQMVHEFQDTSYVLYCGTKLYLYATNMAAALQLASRKSGGGSSIEFIDFSNPDPTYEGADVRGTIDLWKALANNTTPGEEEEGGGGKEGGSLITVSKVTEVGKLDVAGVIGNTDGLVYSSQPGHIPRINIPNLVLKSAGPNASLNEEARRRIQDRAGIDCWHDGNILGIATFAFTAAYAIVRYDKNINGVEPHANIPMYLLDKAFAWTGLWMVVMSPFAGNILTLASIVKNRSKVSGFQQLIGLLCAILMIIPVVEISITWIFWILARNMFFAFRFPVSTMYHSQNPTKRYRSSLVKASLVDIVNLKGETGVIGFIYALIHSFLGIIIADVAYKTNWFVTEEQDNSVGGTGVGVGRLDWQYELSMTTGAMGTVLLWAVSMRSIMGKASWIRLKPLYSYVSPISIWLSTIHVIAFGAKGWYTLFNSDYHNGQMSITFLSSMFPTCILLVHHIFALFGTKKACANDHLWKHSLVNIASVQYKELEPNSLIEIHTAKDDFTCNESIDADSDTAFESFVYGK